MLKLFSGLALACVVTPTFAQDCLSMDKLLAKLKADGDTISADIPIPGARTDRIAIVLDPNGSWLWASKDGCVLGDPVGIDDPAPDAATPAPSAVKPEAPVAPKPQGGGAEIGI